MLIQQIENKCKDAFIDAFETLDRSEFSIEVTRSTKANFGHYQCNSAMKLTKLLNMPPRDIASKVVANLEKNNKDGFLEKCEIAGPGFINLTLSNEAISNLCQNIANEPQTVAKTNKVQKITIDLSSPNTAKEMHVGHLRSTIIGDSLARLFEYLGHYVLRLNHIGDWGTSFGMLIAYIKAFAPQIVSDKKATLTQLVNLYKEAKKRFDENEDFKKESQLMVVSLQSHDKETLAIWEMICEISRKAYQEIYDLLDIKLVERGESFYQPYLADTIKDLENKGLIKISDGAKCLFLDGFVNREGEPLPFMLQKSDGAYNYSTTDMASIRHRIVDEKSDRLIYVTDAGQATHFAMLFKAAEVAGYLDPSKVRADHVPFGLVLGPDGKKFKTRSGETERLIDLLDSAIQKANEILIARTKDKESNTLSEQDIKEIAHVLGINAVKYADLVCNRTHDYVFSYDKMLRFEGNTAAFLMYSYVRIHGIKRKIQGEIKLANIDLAHESEVALGLHLCQFAEILASICDDLMPNRLCEYLFELAEKFNAFFRDCRVEGAPEQNQRLALCELTARVLKEGLTILGLNTVTKM
ncbi:MAG: arginine--tRNA ligase [Proteobacteria bacterium]|nr:arginine--tRNA ligase [Pseudomonadota bacterium]